MINKNKYEDKEDSRDLSSRSSDFCTLLEKTLPLGSQVLRETPDEYKESLKDKEIKAMEDPNRGELELEKEKVKCLRYLLSIWIQKLQRLSADYANFQKRTPKHVAEAIAYEKEKIIKTLLPALDNFAHTFANAHAAESVDAVIKGVRIIYDQIIDILKSHGVEQLNALGKKFDPSQHEAVLQKAEPQQPDGIVLEEPQKGYKLNGHVIRASRVVVNKLQKPEEKEQKPQTTDVE